MVLSLLVSFFTSESHLDYNTSFSNLGNTQNVPAAYRAHTSHWQPSEAFLTFVAPQSVTASPKFKLFPFVAGNTNYCSPSVVAC